MCSVLIVAGEAVTGLFCYEICNLQFYCNSFQDNPCMYGVTNVWVFVNTLLLGCCYSVL